MDSEPKDTPFEPEPLDDPFKKMKMELFTLRAAIGISQLDSPEEQRRKLTLINAIRLAQFPLHGSDHEWNRRDSLANIPFLIENLPIELLEDWVEINSMAVANVSAYLKGSALTIQARRKQKSKEEEEKANVQKEKVQRSQPAARVQLSEDKKIDKALKNFMKLGMTEQKAREFLAQSMKFQVEE